MNEYIFYTAEGNTEAPDENVYVENCQVLGRAYGNNSDEAQEILLRDNPWICEAGFDESEFIVKQLLTTEQRRDIIALIEFMTVQGKKNYEKHEVNTRLNEIIKRLTTI